MKIIYIILSMLITFNAYGTTWPVVSNQSFEGSYAPIGWTRDTDSDKTTTYYYEDGGSWSARFQKNTDFLMTPLIYNADSLKFWWRNGSSTCTQAVNFKVDYSTDSVTWVALPGSPITSACYCAMTEVEIDLSSCGDAYVRWSRGDTKTYYMDYVNILASAPTPPPPTPINTPQPIPTPGVIISQTRDSGTQSYVELYNYNDFPVNLGGYGLKLIIGDYEDSSEDYTFRDCDVIPANSHFLVGSAPLIGSVPADAVANIEIINDSARGNSYIRLLYPRDQSRIADTLGWTSYDTAPEYYRTDYLHAAPTSSQTINRESTYDGYRHENNNRYDFTTEVSTPNNSGSELTYWRCFTMYPGDTVGGTSYYVWKDLSDFPTGIVDEWDHVWVRTWAVCTGDFTGYVRYGSTVQSQPYNYPAEYRKGWNTAPSGGQWSKTILDGLQFGYPAGSKISDSAIQVYYSGSAAPTPSPTPSATPTPTPTAVP